MQKILLNLNLNLLKINIKTLALLRRWSAVAFNKRKLNPLFLMKYKNGLLLSGGAF